MLKISWLISLGISLIGFLIIEHFFSIQPEGVSNSGNLGAVGITLVLPFLLLSLFTTFRFVSTSIIHAKDNLNRVLIVISSLLLVGIFVYFANEYKIDVIESLGGPATDPDSKIYQYPLLNQYTNHIFFNFYTFGLVHSVSGIIGSLIGFYKHKSSRQKDDFCI